MTESEDKNNIHVIAELNCGTKVEAVQPHRGMNLSFTFTPKQGIAVTDFADLKNGVLNIRMTEESLVGLYQLLRLIADPAARPKKPKSFFEELFQV